MKHWHTAMFFLGLLLSLPAQGETLKFNDRVIDIDAIVRVKNDVAELRKALKDSKDLRELKLAGEKYVTVDQGLKLEDLNRKLDDLKGLKADNASKERVKLLAATCSEVDRSLSQLASEIKNRADSIDDKAPFGRTVAEGLRQKIVDVEEHHHPALVGMNDRLQSLGR